ncbi:AEC family transporter [Peptoniphilus catoniae]|uniref:AEC family transporter n=1 Tax=Peptoniphilus catoniae TaxID=1660341 RepID=UPI0010FEBB84|nr:AEC family transporter [Peptoniphilus catoniae]
MEYFGLGISAIFPIFLVLFLGYFLKVLGFIDENFTAKGTKIIFYFILPCTLFFDIRDSELKSFDRAYIVYILLGVCAIYGITWFVAKHFIKDRRKLSAFVHCAYRSNFIFIGVPILDAITDSYDMDPVIAVFMFGIVLYNFLAIVLLTYYGEDEINFKEFFYKVVKNPMIITIIVGMLARKYNIYIYQGVEDAMHMIGKIASPFSLILVGSSLNFSKDTKDMGLAIGSAFIKDVLGALILVPIAYFLGFSNDQILVAYVYFATPCAVNCFVMGRSMGSDGELTSKIITASFVMSIFSYAVGIALLQYFGIVAV